VDGLEVSTIVGLLLTRKSVFGINNLSKIFSGQENYFLKILSKKLLLSRYISHFDSEMNRSKKSMDRKNVI
jgi:hypothetical protein